MAAVPPRFLAGLGAGLAVLPLTIAFGVLGNVGPTPRWTAFFVLLAAGLVLGPRRLDRVAGYVTGLLVTLLAAAAWAMYVLSQWTS